MGDKEIVYQMLYAMEMLSYKGISIGETVRRSLKYYIDNYRESGEKQYLDLALLQIKAGLEFGIMEQECLLLYNEVCILSEMQFEDIQKKELFVSKKIKLSKSQVRKVFRKWKQSKENGMTLSELVTDVIHKVSDKMIGNYIYSYRKYDSSENKDNLKKDIYHLVVNDTESYLFDLKEFTVYTFDNGKEKECK